MIVKMENINLEINWEKIGWVIEWDNSENIIIFVHGFTGDMNGPDDLFVKLSEELQWEWFSVCRFDFRWWWMSWGDFIDMTIVNQKKDLEWVIGYIQDQWYSSISILWESMWWTVIWTLDDLNIFDSIVFWYSAFDLLDTDLEELLLSEKWKKEFSEKWYVDCDWFKIWKAFRDEFVDIKIDKELEEIKVPVLLLHWDKDGDVNFKQSEVAYWLITSEIKKLKIIEWADHCFRNEHDEVILDTVDFIKNN